MLRALKTISVHFDKGEARSETLLGVDYYVVPVIAMVEGVRYGANQDAPELGLASEFGDVPVAWANRPLVLNHPQIDGTFVSANTPDILETYQFGLTMNPEIKDNKLHMEAWIDVARAKKLGGDFKTTVNKILDNEEVEVSVGFFSDVKPQKGKYKGQAYSGVWTNIKPDHLAILSDAIGACSIEDGCGVPRLNQATIGEEMAELKTNCSCEDSTEPTAQVEEVVTITAPPAVQVDVIPPKIKAKASVPSVQSTTPLAVELEVLEAHKPIRASNQAIVDSFVRTQKINTSLMNNDIYKMVSLAIRKKFGTYAYLYGYTSEVAVYETYNYNDGGYVCMQIGINVSDTAVEFVGEPEEVILQTKIVPQLHDQTVNDVKENDMTTQTNVDPTAPVVQTDPAAPAPVTISKPADAPVVQAKPLTAQEYIDQAPAEVREVMQSAMKLQASQKTAAIKTLTDYKGNKFSEEYLKTQSLEALENMVGLLPPVYSGQAAPTQIGFNANSEGRGETVPAPLVFERKKAAAA